MADTDEAKKILLVDDEEMILDALGMDLTQHGFKVSIAGSGEDAIALLEKDHFDLVVTDLLMGGMNGLEVLQKTKLLDLDIGVIILTAFGDMTTAIDALRLGADDFMLKPCDLNELRFRIHNSLDKYELKKRIKVYENILPVCSYCKKIRDDSDTEHGAGKWMSLEEYFHSKAKVEVSHGCCTQCMIKVLAE